MKPFQSVNRRVPLGGCDRYLLALEDLMIRSGQGRHVGVTVIEVAPGFSVGKLRNAVSRFASSQPLLAACLARGLLGIVPKWVLGSSKITKLSERQGLTVQWAHRA